MNNKVNFYTLGRDLTIKKKPYSKKLFTSFVSNKTLDFKYLFSELSSINTFFIKEYEEDTEIVPLSASWILDNYYLFRQQYFSIKDSFRSNILKKLPVAEYDVAYYQIHYLARKFLEATNCEFVDENLVQFLNGYQKIYPLTSLELWILPTVIKYELLNIVLSKGIEIKEKIQNGKIANDIVERISIDLSKGKNPINTVKSTIKNKSINPSVLLAVLDEIRELDYRVEATLAFVEGKVHEEDLDLEEFTRANVLRDSALKQTLTNAVTSIKSFTFINWNKLFSRISIVEHTLLQDPAGIYQQMDDISKDRYRHVVEDLSANSNFSESGIARKVIEIASSASSTLERHVGYYLIDDGYPIFTRTLNFKPSLKGRLKDFCKIHPNLSYFSSIAFFTILSSIVSAIIFQNIHLSTIFTLVLLLLQLIPVSNIAITITNRIFLKFLPPALPPKIDMHSTIDNTQKTLVVVPCMFSNIDQIDKLVRNLETRFLSNKYCNLYFALLIDYKDADVMETEGDRALLLFLRKKIKLLNQKHKAEGLDSFFLFQRNRVFVESEGVWMGWERKRGKLLQIVHFLSNLNLKETNGFSVVDGDISKLQDIKYIITLDEDTMLPADTALKLIGAMAHPLNTPVLDNNTHIVTRGYGFIQPRIILDPEVKSISPFTKIFVDESGYDSYSVAISDIYQDLFNRSNFMGKGIFNVAAINQSLSNRFPDNVLLSHDLIESCFARCGYLSDTSLMEDFPTTLESFMARDNRWVRGDWQLLPWLSRKIRTSDGKIIQNPMDMMSYWMIFDNLLRSLYFPSYVLLLVTALLAPQQYLGIYILFLYFWPITLDIISSKRFFIHKMTLKEQLILAYKFITKKLVSTLTIFIIIQTLAFGKVKAIIAALNRLKTGKHLLEWTTHSDTESSLEKGNTKIYTEIILVNLLLFLTILMTKNLNFFNVLILFVWISSQILITKIGIPYKKKNNISNDVDKARMTEYAKRIWNFFDEYTNDISNNLPPDNLQLYSSKRVAYRTSPTNIGFYLLSLLSAYDLKFIDFETFATKLEKTLLSIYKLPKYKGHLYNWYDIKTLLLLTPYISTADSGNFVVSLMLIESACHELSDQVKQTDPIKSKKLLKLAQIINKLYVKTDFTLMYNKTVSIFAIGFNTITKQKDVSYFDLLASESRIASYVSIALDQVEIKHWFNLGRPLQIKDGKYYLMSWGGTMFEYLLPTLLFNEKLNTILNQTTREVLERHKEYGKENGIPWGISESNYDSFDFDSNYQYKMMGISELALKRYETKDLVVSPYSSFLALMVDAKAAEANLKEFEKLGALGTYGFYESIDFNRTKMGTNVETYTAHHQGMSLVAINNVLNNNIMKKRLHNNDYIKSCEILLDEKIPEVSNTVEPNQNMLDKKLFSSHRFENEHVRYSSTPNTLFPLAQIYGNNKYSVMISNSGSGYSKYKDTYLNRFKQDFTLNTSGSFIYVKDNANTKVWSATHQPTLVKPDAYEARFYAELVEFKRIDNQIETQLNIFVPPENNFEIRELTFVNHSDEVKKLEITSYSEIMLDDLKSGSAHPAFNKLFVETSFENNVLIAKRKIRNSREVEKFAFHFGVPGDKEFVLDSVETSRSEFLGRLNDPQNPQALFNPLKNNTGTVLDPIFSERFSLTIKAGEQKKLAFVYGYAANIHEINAIKDLLSNYEQIQQLKNLNTHYVEAKRTHLGIDIKLEQTFQKVASRLVYPDYRLQMHTDSRLTQGKSALYRFSISGENKIVVLKVNSKNIELVRNMVLLHEYFRLLNFRFDLVFLIDEVQSYEQALEKDVYQVVESSLSKPYKGTGVYILNSNKNSYEENSTLLNLAGVVLDTSLGTLDDQINLASSRSESDGVAIKQRNHFETTENIQLDAKNPNALEYFNGFGGFSNAGKHYIINTSLEKPTPQPWSNVIANSKFGTLVTESGLGYTWNINSQTNKITPWSNDPISDPQGEIIYIKDTETGEFYTATPLPFNKSDFKVTHSQGYTEFLTTRKGIESLLKVFVAPEDSIKLLQLTLTNNSNRSKSFECSHYVEFVMCEERPQNQKNLNIVFDPTDQFISATNNTNDSFIEQVAFMSSNAKIVSATSDREKFFGRGNSKKNPSWVLNSPKGAVGFKNVSDKCGVLTSLVEVPKNSQVTLILTLGQAGSLNEARALIEKFSLIENANSAFEVVTNTWKQLNSALTVKTPDKKFNFLINNWLLYQVVSCRLNGRTSFYQAGGAYGFRDQLQDVMALVYSDPRKTRDQILLCCAHQFKEGDVQHWWHNPTNAGVRTKISDDLLWLPYVVSHYVDKTGDTTILQEIVPFIESPLLGEHEESSYVVPNISQETATVEEHCKRAIEKSLKFGEHGIPFIGTGDWNDSLNSVGDEGRGESTWLGWFLITVLDKYSEIISNPEEIKRYNDISAKLRLDINQNCWDGEWFTRAIHDDGTILGSNSSEECKIDSISQTWSVISKSGDKDKVALSLHNHEKYLEDRDASLVKLLAPSFAKSTSFPGYIQGYPEGVRENGGQYTHGAVWAVKAYAMINDGDKAYQIFDMLNPISKTLNKDLVKRYMLEPYIMAADVYTNPKHYGKGGWSWYSGSAGWMYQVAVDEILGLKLHGHYFSLHPAIPSSWNFFEITFKHNGVTFNISVKRGESKGLYLNDKKLEENKIYFRSEMDLSFSTEIEVLSDDERRISGLHTIALPSNQQENSVDSINVDLII